MTSTGASRPDLLVGVVGTATEVGKTWVTARCLEQLTARGLLARARKPAQSFDPDEPHPLDAEVLAAASGDEPDRVCPPGRSYPVPMAPPMAADVLGLAPPSLADVLGELSWPPGVDVGFVETVGGVRSPVTDDADSAGLVAAVAPDRVLLVADAGLGTIDAVRSAAGALGPDPLVLLNRFDDAADLHRRNRSWLVERDGFRVSVSIEEVVADLLAGG